MTLNNLAGLYSNTERMKDAEDAYKEALETYRQLANTNPAAYQLYVAFTLNNVALLELRADNLTLSARRRGRSAEHRPGTVERNAGSGRK